MSPAMKDRIKELEDTLAEAKIQIEYLHEKFQKTGSGESVLALINNVLNDKSWESDLYWEEKLEGLEIERD